MQTAIEISLEDTDTLQDHYQPTNDIPEEALALIKAWEESFSKTTRNSPKQHSDDIDLFVPTDLSLPPQRYRRNPVATQRNMKLN